MRTKGGGSTFSACQSLKLGVKRNRKIEERAFCLLALLPFPLITFKTAPIKLHNCQRLITNEESTMKKEQWECCYIFCL